MQNITLGALIDEYVASMASGGYSASTRRTFKRTAELFLSTVGNIQVKHVQARHVDSFFASRQAAGISPGTLNLELVVLRGLFRFAMARRHMPPGQPDPASHRRRVRNMPKTRRRIPASEFERLLDATRHPRDRMVLALGIYLLARQSEIIELRIGDVDLVHGAISARIIKTAQVDTMPISTELDRELRRWLTFYAERCGPLEPHWRLVPAKARPQINELRDRDMLAAELKPLRPMVQPERIVQNALVACGYEVRDADGRPTRDGVHTLRRSSARALFDRLAERGYDNAGRIVQAMLHHASFKQTETYLGIDMDSKHRDEIIRGQEMFPVATDNVLVLNKEARG